MRKLSGFMLLFLLFASSLCAEIRYIEIDSIKNVPVIEIKSVDDFEAIINEYGIKIGYLQKNSAEPILFVIADAVYFSFNLNGYYSLSDYKIGQSKKFSNGTDYNKALSLGFETSELYYYYTRNTFYSVDDCKDAYKNKFVNIQNYSFEKKNESTVYYEAKKAGYLNYSDYQEYLDYNHRGFKNKTDWQSAKQKGFTKGEDYYTATKNGFDNYSDFNSAKKVGISNNDDYQLYFTIIESFERIMKNRGLEKKFAIIYYYIQNLPKGDIGLSALSNSLNEVYSQQSRTLTDAINLWYSDINSIDETQKKNRNVNPAPKKNLSVKTFFSQTELSNFLLTVDVSVLGTYNPKTEIFRKK